ncbi:endonuclease/exonuclease/phosphatase family metal-dependent hydrolase [Hoeflea halophila]|uniref:Endonuclease/exonuclease/phosphatase family metal-dependent hydrolase n=2 Tax=Hoeflea halophila TaxID=714899 RepID=A0A286HS37_9HYPH|nr:endonuclease/exonuclease/phosphatase family metal-dependent hydrolase [Hoeflea halophila]
MKLLSYNIQACIGSRHYSDYLFGIRKQIAHSPVKDRTLRKIGSFISGFDIVCLQELDLGGRRGGFSSQFDALKKISGFRFGAAQTTRIIPGVSQHGNAIFSRYPIDEVEEYRLPGRMKGRGLLVCTIKGHTVANTHLSLYAKMQVRQLELISEVLQGREKTILAGDFNCRSAHPTIRNFATRSGLDLITGNTTNTYPSWKPTSDIDHIFVSRTIPYKKPEVLDVRLSDHLPLQTEFELLDQ